MAPPTPSFAASSRSEQETKPPPGSPPGLLTRKLRYCEIPSTVQFSARALLPGPLQHYLRDTRDSNNFAWNILWRLQIAIGYLGSVRDGLAYTVGPTAHAIMAYTPYSDSPKSRPPWERFLRWFSLFVLGNCQWLTSKEQRKRYACFKVKVEETVKQTLGDQEKEMYYLNLLATDPKCQGRGYGSALVGVCTREADRQGRATWLLSSDIRNTGFYNSLGFYTKAEIIVGEDDPEWDEPPVVMCLMIREARTHDDKKDQFDMPKVDA